MPKPQSVVFEGVATLKDGKTDPSQQGLTWEIGKGKMFYFQPGHETNPVFMDENIKKIMINAVRGRPRRRKPPRRINRVANLSFPRKRESGIEFRWVNQMGWLRSANPFRLFRSRVDRFTDPIYSYAVRPPVASGLYDGQSAV